MSTVASRPPPAPARSLSAPPQPHGGADRRDAAVRTGAGVVLWFSLMLVTYWWAADGELQKLAGWSTGLDSAGRLTGLVASVLLLAQVILMARLPVVERAYGQDVLAGIHRVVGFTSFNLMVAHVVLITWGYAVGDLTRTPATLWDLTRNYPGMLLAIAGTACLVLVVFTSIKAARSRLRYESWHLLHLYAYLGVGLALPHQLWTGQQFTASPGRTVFWWTAWAATVGAVLVWRVGRPVWLNLRHQLRVTAVVDEAPGIWSVHLTGRRLDRLRVEPGQFLTFRFRSGPGWTRAHPYSLSAAPGGRRLRITVQGVGDGSTATRSLRPGTRVLIEGPFGRLTHRPRTQHKVALIGAGVGTAPLRALADGLTYAPGEAVYLERFTHHPVFSTEVDALARGRGLRVVRLPGHRRSPGSWLGDGVPQSLTGTCCGSSSPTSPTATSTSAAPGRGPNWSSTASVPTASSPPTSIPRSSAGDRHAPHHLLAAQHDLRSGAALQLSHVHLWSPGRGPPPAYVSRTSPGTTTSQGDTGSRSSAQATTRTVTGAVAETQWGPVQVQLTLQDHTITQASVLQYPTGNATDEQINGYALPILVDETTAAQGAGIDMVSGATVTSNGYLQSLQSALDQAGL